MVAGIKEAAPPAPPPTPARRINGHGNGNGSPANGHGIGNGNFYTQAQATSDRRRLVHDEDEIVISGISGRFPESGDMNEFMENLLNNVNMVTVNERRFKPGLYGIPHGFGTLKEIDKFDADAFGMLPNQVKKTDPQLRMTLETTYEAMCDGGVNPADERGSRTGVFLGLCTSESQSLWSQELNRVDGLALIGCTNSMFANRVSFTFDFKGPSCAYDTACSTSIFALEAAVSAMRAGKCDAAIVTASTLILTPNVNVQFTKLGMLAKDGLCKSFDKSGDGFARAEAVATIYLQRASVAKRAYASILHIKTNTDGYKDNGITYPSAMMQEELLREVYREAGINKDEVSYVEAHGTGTAIGDPQEVTAISRIFKARQVPLLVGSVKSNMGHAEGASGLCSIAKIVIMLQTGVIPANLHFNEPSFSLNYIRNGHIKVVDQNMIWRGGCIAVNSFGFGGVNTHFVLRPFKRRKTSSSLYSIGNSFTNEPRLVLFAGRSEPGVAAALRRITDTNDPNLILLVNDMSKTPNPVANVRGFSISDSAPPPTPLSTNGSEESQSQSVPVPQNVLHTQTTSGSPPPLWFVFNGIGSQWIGMGQGLLQIPTFAKSVKKSATVLRTRFNFDLYGLLNATTTSPETYDKPTNCFVGITAVQIGLVDVLSAVGIRPAGFLGHSAGEMACAYADGCLTAEETIICAYLRGESLESSETEPEPGAMAVVSMSWPQVEKLCPPGVYPACHNGIDSVTVSGSKQLLAAFVKDMKDNKKKGVKEVNSCGVAFHSPYIAKASRAFLAALRAAFKSNPSDEKVRSAQWISTSIPEADWGSSLHTTASPEYFVNNFLSPVLFYEGLQHIPEGAVVVEVGPSGLLRGLVKKACPTVTVVPLQARDSKQSMVDLLTALGKLYLTGIAIDANKLVLPDGPSRQIFPVPLGTPFLSPLIASSWDHSTNWDVPSFGMNGELQHARFEIDMSSESDSFLAGHVVQGRILFPATGYLVLVWRHYAQSRQMQQEECLVVFENVRLNRATVLSTRAKVEFRIHISEISGRFEIKEGGAIVATGIVRGPDTNPAVSEVRMEQAEFDEIRKTEMEKLCESGPLLDESHIYKRFRFAGFEYQGLFRGIQKCDRACSSFLVAWNKNWITFLDTFLQTCIQPFEKVDQVKLPTAITKLVLDPARFLESLPSPSANDQMATTVFVRKSQNVGLIKCNGIELHWPKLTTVSKHTKEASPVLSSYSFTPYFDEEPETNTEEPGASTRAPHKNASPSPLLDCATIIMKNITSNRPGDETSLSLTVVELTTSEAEVEHLESVAMSNFIWLNFGILDMSYTVFAHSCPEELQAQFANTNITLKGFNTFQKESFLDKSYDVIVLHNQAFLLLASEYLKKGSFLLLKCAQGTVTRESLLEKMGPKLNLIAVKHSPTHTVHLIRKRTKHPSTKPVAIPVSSKNLHWVPRLQSVIREQEAIFSAGQQKPPRVYLVSNGEPESDSGIRGLLNCIRKEQFSQQFRMIFSKKKVMELDFKNPTPELARILEHDLAVNIFDEEGRWGFYSMGKSLSPKSATTTRRVKSAFIGMGAVGDLSTFRWIEGHDFKSIAIATTSSKFVPIEVHFAALNFKDIMLATGNLPAPEPSSATPYHIESSLGLEFAGVALHGSESGTRFCGYIESQAIATQVLGFRDQLWTIPSHWSYAQAATVPVVYATAYMALVIRGNIQDGESILIHSGAGGVGQAAIRIALSHNCVVFTTVGSVDKKEFLATQFPDIPQAHIGNSRDTSFETLVMSATQGRGVDLVLNSLSGEKLDASVRCLARHGRFLEIGKFDLQANKVLGMELFLKNASFHGVMLDSLYDANPRMVTRLKEVVQAGIDEGVVQPLPSRVFGIEQVEPAFRCMGTGKHIGKILIEVRKQDEGSDPQPLLLDAHPRIYFDPSKSYIVIGGLGGIGLEFVNWMIMRNAKRLVITSRSGISNAYQSEYINAWRTKQGASIEVLTLDASKMEDATKLLEQATALGPLDGFFNLALQLELAFMKDQTEASFAAVMNPKAVLTRNMDDLTRRCCPQITHFVVFSSVIAGVGMPGQANYGMANSATEEVCEKRCRDGLAGKAIQLGPISEVGFFHEMHHAKNSTQQLTSYAGIGVQSIGSVLKCMDVLLSVPDPIVASKVDRELGGSKTESSANLPMGERVGRILGTDISKLNPKTKLTELGLDSIMSMELKQVLEQDYGIVLSATEIRTVTIEQLIEMGKNNASTDLGPRKLAVGPRRAATADLFQFDFMRNAKKTKILYKQCVHRLNERPDSGSDSIFVCNSVEGPHILRILGTLLKKQAYTMQFPEDAPLHDMRALTDYYMNELRATRTKGPYVIAGYSAGIFIAIELALRLQESGEISKLVLIDLTPGRADAIFEENFGADRDKIDETGIMVATLSQVLSIDREHLETVVGGLTDREARIKKAVEIGTAFFDEKVDSKIFERLFSESPMKLINLFNHYKPGSKYHGKIVLVKTTQNLISYDSTEFWGLEEFCTQTPIVHTVESTHSYLVAEPGVHHVAAAINND